MHALSANVAPAIPRGAATQGTVAWIAGALATTADSARTKPAAAVSAAAEPATRRAAEPAASQPAAAVSAAAQCAAARQPLPSQPAAAVPAGPPGANVPVDGPRDGVRRSHPVLRRPHLQLPQPARRQRQLLPRARRPRIVPQEL